MISKYRPQSPILAITRHEHVLAKICLLFGVIPIKGDSYATTDEMFEASTRLALENGHIASGDTVVLSAGIPLGESGRTNLLQIQQV